ncbi:unnamed protein product [Chironomus riparius]|uniref:Uncharacterized protein n=1 Tax=Chironomus riparius TaxID=315576 RepID=A0A9N9RHT0_9DIPT|nr:unnamed protein product [Chironomus riparius]
MKFITIFSVLFVSVMAKSCIHEWRIYHGTTEPLLYGVFVGNFQSNNPAFIGRGIHENLRVTGRIQTVNPPGLYHVSFGKIHHIPKGVEYLVKNPNYDYKWISSSNGEYVENAISPGYTPGLELHFVGRMKIDGRTYYGKVLPNVGMYYEDGNQKEVLASQYQIIVCNNPTMDNFGRALPIVLKSQQL